MTAAVVVSSLISTADAAAPVIRVIVGYPAGGTLDVLTRQVLKTLSEQTKNNYIVDNRPGADGAIAAQILAGSTPDGNTLMVAPLTLFSLIPLTNRTFPVKSADFSPVISLARFDYAFGVGESSPIQTAKQFVDTVRQNPALGIFGTPGAWGAPQFFGAAFAKHYGIAMKAIPYSGTPPLIQNLQGQQLSAAVLPMTDFGRLVKNKTARLLATTASQRSRDFPQVPTFKELGIPIDAGGEYVLYAPAKIAIAQKESLIQAFAAVLHTAATERAFAQMYMTPTGNSGASLNANIAASQSFWMHMVDQLGGDAASRGTK